MKKSVRNRLLAVTAAAVSSFLLLSGFDSSLTSQDVAEKGTEALASMGGFSAQVKGVADVSIDVAMGDSSQSLPLTGNADYAVEVTLDPFVMGVNGGMSGEFSAQGMSGNMDIGVYLLEQEDGTGIVYAHVPMGDDTGWHAAQVPTEYVAMVKGYIDAALSGSGESIGINLEELKQELGEPELASEAVNVNGVDCYELTQSVGGDALINIISKVAAAVPQAGLDENTLGMASMLFSGLRLDAVSDYSVEDFTPVFAKMDLAGSDFSMLGQMAGAMMGLTASEDAEATPEINVAVNALNVTMDYAAPPAAIEIPEEALAAEVETTLSMDDLTGAAGAVLE